MPRLAAGQPWRTNHLKQAINNVLDQLVQVQSTSPSQAEPDLTPLKDEILTAMAGLLQIIKDLGPLDQIQGQITHWLEEFTS